jgi:hypothetical protein
MWLVSDLTELPYFIVTAVIVSADLMDSQLLLNCVEGMNYRFESPNHFKYRTEFIRVIPIPNFSFLTVEKLHETFYLLESPPQAQLEGATDN